MFAFIFALCAMAGIGVVIWGLTRADSGSAYGIVLGSGLVYAVALLGFAALLPPAIWDGGVAPRPGPAVPTTPRGPTDVEAWGMCKQFVSQQLRAPASAQFQSYADIIVRRQDSDTFQMNGYVDSQNAFGAMLRLNFSCTVAYVGDDRWRLVELTER